MPNLKFLLTHPAHFFALGFGSGLAKKAPGTIGTLLGLPLFLLILQFSPETKLIIIAALFIIGVYICNITGENLGSPDDPSIVWDEIVAIMLVLTFTPFHWVWWFISFSLFRLFDIWKPFPIRQFDAKLKNGFGVMFDDLLAAIYTIISINIIAWILSLVYVAP